MNTLNFNQSGGFPLETNILDEMQKAYAIFNALGSIAGNFSIISGCEVEETTAANGVVFINGEVLPFVGGTVQANVKIIEVVTAKEFEDLNTRDVIYTRHATFGTAAVVYPWIDFKRPIPTKDLAALFSGIAEQFNTIITKLNTIEEGAQVQLPTDWNATTGVTQLLNKPSVATPFLYKGTAPVGDFSSDTSLAISFSTVGTGNYIVVGSMVSQGTLYDQDNDVIWTIKNRTPTGFSLLLRETADVPQNLQFTYALIEL